MNDVPTHHPNMIDRGELEKNGLICWRDVSRACGADCMAYNTPPPGVDTEGKQWAYCRILVDEHRTAKHLVIIASSLGELLKTKKNEAADRARLNQPPPPKVV